MKPIQLSPLVQALNAKLEQKLTTVASLAELLHCSADSLYRRLRGETDFLHNEAIILCNNLNISLDALYKLPTGYVQFNTRQLISTNLDENAVEAVTEYINKLHKDLSDIDKLGIVQLYYAAKDIPLFSFFSHPNLVSFKLYFWHMLLFNDKAKRQTYNPKWLPKTVVEKAMNLHKIYNTNPSIEIWNFETINSTLHQLVYCVSSGLMELKDAKNILVALQEFINQLEQNCEQGTKNNVGKLQFYFNELLLLDNSVIFDLGHTKVFYMPFQTLNFFYTSNASFVESTVAWMIKQQAKSTIISQTGERDRNRLFKHYKLEMEKCSLELSKL